MPPLLFLLVLLSLLAVTGVAWVAVRTARRRYLRLPSRAGLTGAEVARRVMVASGVTGVRVEPAQGRSSDHYDAGGKVLRLTPGVYGGRSMAAMGLAAHEAGHAIQDARRYGPLLLRRVAVPGATVGSALGLPLLAAGLLAAWPALAAAGLAIFGAGVLAQLLSLPVEIDASRRVVKALAAGGLVTTPEEERGIQTMLMAAALAYVGESLTGVFRLIRNRLPRRARARLASR